MRPRSRLKTLMAAVVTVLLAATGVAGSAAQAEPTDTVVASGAAARSDLGRLLRPTGSRTAVWLSPSASGATLTTRFAAPTWVDGTAIRAAAASLRIAEVRLEFSDGSALAVHTDVRGDRMVAFPARRVRWVRLVVAGVATGQRAVGLSAWRMRHGRSEVASTSASRLASADVTVSSGAVLGTRWASARTGEQWLLLRWRRPVAVSAVRISGGAESAATSIESADLRFSDGSVLGTGSLEPRGATPTTIAFTPRVTTSVRLVVTSVRGGARASIRSIRVYPTGVVPPPVPVTTPTYQRSWTPARSCAGVVAVAPTATLRLLCPTNGTRIGGDLHLVLSGPAGVALTVRAWSSDPPGQGIRVVAHGWVAPTGTARITVPVRTLLHGPAAVRVSAAGVRTPLYVQFVNPSGVRQRAASTPITRGMTLEYDEDFSRPLSATRTGAGAVYASGKPNFYGVDDFGAAIFSQPDGTPDTSSTVPGGFLRIPARPLAASQSDPAGYGRTASGGLISSAHLGGSGFSAQYGYFEVRMLAPGGAGTWPAFWMLSVGSLGGGSQAEIDAVELYGHDTRTAYQTAHSWVDGKDVLGRSVAPITGDWALSWHTFGARMTPSGTDFFVDGIRTMHTPPVVHADQACFFLLDLALTNEWRAGLSDTAHRADLFVDSVRVWV